MIRNALFKPIVSAAVYILLLMQSPLRKTLRCLKVSTHNYYAANCKVCYESLPQNYLITVIHQMSPYKSSHHMTGLLIVATQEDQKTQVSSPYVRETHLQIRRRTNPPAVNSPQTYQKHTFSKPRPNLRLEPQISQLSVRY